MIYSHIKVVVAHIMMLKVIDDILKYSFHITLNQVKIFKITFKLSISKTSYIDDRLYS